MLNNYVLLFSMAIILAVEYLKHRNILSPGVLAPAVFCVSTILLVLNKKWNIEISFSTYVFIVFAIIAFCIGSELGSRVLIRNKVPDEANSVSTLITSEIKNSIMMIFSLISVAVCAIYIFHQYRLSLQLGNVGGLVGFFTAIRSQVQLHPEVYELGVGLNIGMAFGRAIGYISIYMIVQKLIYKENGFLRYVIPVVSLILEQVFSGARGGFISVVTAIVFATYIIAKNDTSGNIRTLNKKIVKNIIVGIAAFIAVFWVIGNYTGSSTVMNFQDTISIYAGSPLVCLDNMFKKGWPISESFGLYSFKGIYAIIRRLGFDVTVISNHMEMVRWSGYASNVYTSFFPFLRDFGAIITVVIELFLGIVFGISWKKFNTLKVKSLTLILYGRYWGYALAMFSIAERVCSQYLALNIFFEMFIEFVIIRYFIKDWAKTNIKA